MEVDCGATAPAALLDANKIWEKRVSAHQEWVALSTRGVPDQSSGVVTQFTRSALEDMARQASEKNTLVFDEHLAFLPPLGSTTGAEVRTASDGESELYLRTSDMRRQLLEPAPDLESTIARLPIGESPHLPPLSVIYDRRNFDAETSAAIEADSDVAASPMERWAECPPLTYIFLLPVVWGAYRFAGSFLDQLGRNAADALSKKIASWSARSRDPSRKAVLTLQFDFADGSELSGYTFSRLEDTEAKVRLLFQAAEELASIAGVQDERGFMPAMRKAAFFLDDDGNWQLGWWTDGKDVFMTKWFMENPPDARGVLGREDP